MRLTFRQLLVFKTVAEQKSFRKGAKILHTSQPALSNAVKALEDVLGVSVFERTTRSLGLTAAGRELYGRIGPIFKQLDEAVVSTQDVAAGRGGTISIAYIDFAILGPLPDILERHREVNPRVQINIRFGSTKQQIDALRSGTIDVGFIMDIDTALPPGIRRCEIGLEGLVAVMPPTHRLAQRNSIELAELADEYFVTGDAGWERYNDLIYDLCVKRDFVPRVRQKAFLRDEMLSFVLAGHGVLIYPECIKNAGRFGLTMVPIHDVPRLIKTVAIWKGNSANPVLPSFLQLLLV